MAVRLLLPVVAILTVAGVMSSFLQNSPRLVLDRIQPKLSRLSIGQGWSRIFGAKGHVEFLKSVAKLAGSLHPGLPAAARRPNGRPERHVHGAQRAAFADLWRWEPPGDGDRTSPPSCWLPQTWSGRACSGLHDLRMTRQEVKDEMKQVDGDPLVKARLRSLARDRARKRMIAAVPKATFVVTNPTHYAIALRYVKEEGGAPLVIAKGQDLIALKIREIATPALDPDHRGQAAPTLNTPPFADGSTPTQINSGRKIAA